MLSLGISYERIIWELKRAMFSFKGSAAMAILLLQVPVLAFVSFKGAGAVYADMIGIMIFIILFSWFFVSAVHGNRKILIYTLMLLTVGTMLQCIFIREAMLKYPDSYTGKAPAAGLQIQYLMALLGASLVSFVYYKWKEISSMKMCRLLFIISSAISLMTILLSAGTGGVKNWIRIGGLSIQTTEINKLLYLFLAAGLLGTVELPSRKRLRAFYLVTLVQAGFLAIQSEYGTLLLLLVVFFAYLFLFVPDLKIFLRTGAAFALFIICTAFTGYQLSQIAGRYERVAANPLIKLILKAGTKISNRFIYWLHPEKDPLGLGYQLLKARESLVLGGWFGTASVTDLPVKTSDLVYPALIQRCGMIFALLVFFIFILMWLEGLRLFVRKEDRYHQSLAAGIVIMMFVQTIIIIAGSTGLCPLTGITLPFISSGGSSLLVSFIMMGLLITISGNVRWKGEGDEEAEEFFKESKTLTRLVAGARHFAHTVPGPYLRTVAGRFKGGRPEKSKCKAEGVSEGIHKGEHS